MRGQRSVWRRVQHLETQQTAAWAGPLPVICPQEWAPAEHAAWDAARATGDEATMDALVARHAGVRRRPVEAGIRCIVMHHPSPRRDEPCAS